MQRNTRNNNLFLLYFRSTYDFGRGYVCDGEKTRGDMSGMTKGQEGIFPGFVRTPVSVWISQKLNTCNTKATLNTIDMKKNES